MVQLAGFIFMCNGKTKPECYRYRVFGVPKGQKEIVEKIKPGTKLFLFDFELRLLYGVYEATSSGELNLEQAAFDGKFPAQVRFKICEDCLPLNENALKHAIYHDSRKGSRFRQELNSQQVQNLMSLFRPISMLSSTPAAPSRVMTLPAMEVWCQPPARLPPPEDPQIVWKQQSHAPMVLEPRQAQRALPPQHNYPENRANIGCTRPDMDGQCLPTQSDMFYSARVQQPYFLGHSITLAPGLGPVQQPYFLGQSVAPAQDPVQPSCFVGHSATPGTDPYQRHGTVQEIGSHTPHNDYGNGYYQLSFQGESGTVAWGQNAFQDYNSHLVVPTANAPSAQAHVPAASGETVLLGANNPSSDPSVSWGAPYVYQ